MTILIADDHPLYRQGLARVLEQANDCTIVGQAENGRVALELILQKRPDLAVVDISMPEMDGLQLVRAAMGNEECLTEFIILTMYNEEAYFSEAMDLGVRGYLLKDSAPNEILSCVRSVSDGIPFVSSHMSHYLVNRLSRLRPPAPHRPSIADLTPAERRILRMLGQNRTSKEIARELSISIRTVQNHRATICTKLNLQGFNKLLQFALENRAIL